MKILELIEQIQTTIEPEGRYSGRFRSSKDHTVPSGYFSNVRADKRDPHMVVKNTAHVMRDRYNDYIALLIDRNLMSENIHFPRVYNVRRITDNNNDTIYKHKVEKLEHMQDLPYDIQMTILKQNFNLDDYAVDDNDTNLASLAAGIMYRALSYKGDSDGIKSESLKEALRILREIYLEKRWSLDLHSKNFMIRKSPAGFQIVITDPFS